MNMFKIRDAKRVFSNDLRSSCKLSMFHFSLTKPSTQEQSLGFLLPPLVPHSHPNPTSQTTVLTYVRDISTPSPRSEEKSLYLR